MMNRKTFQLRFVAMSLSVAMLGVLGATSASAVQRVYAGQLRFGFGDGGITGMGSTVSPGTLNLDAAPGGGTEVVDDANNAIPPCAAPGATVTPSGMGNAPAATASGAGPQTGTINFHGLADVVTTGGGAIDPSAPIQFFKVTATTAGLNNWGLTTNCPIYTNGVPGDLLFRRTQMAQFSWPSTTGTVQAGAGAVPATTVSGGTNLASLTAAGAPGAVQRVGAVAGPNRYGGSVGMVGTADTLLGFNSIPAYGLPSAIGTLPIPLAFGINGGTGVTPGSGTGVIPTGSTIAVSPPPFKAVTAPSQRDPGGPVPPTTAADVYIPFASGVGLAWTTGAVTAFDSLGDFRTTRTRTGAAVNAGPFTGATTASLQLVSPGVLFLGLGGLPPLGIAITAELDINFVPEPASLAALGAGVAVLGGLYGYRRRNRREVA